MGVNIVGRDPDAIERCLCEVAAGVGHDWSASLGSREPRRALRHTTSERPANLVDVVGQQLLGEKRHPVLGSEDPARVSELDVMRPGKGTATEASRSDSRHCLDKLAVTVASGFSGHIVSRMDREARGSGRRLT
jgi:hypothetical protein